MKHKIMFLIVIFAAFVFAENEKFATGPSLGITNSDVMPNSMYLPILSISQYLFRPIWAHEVTMEYMNITNEKGPDEKNYLWMGFGYSILFKMPLNCFYVGPNIGFYGLSYEHKNQILINVSSNGGAYLGGGNLTFIFGDGWIRFKIQNKILFGASWINGNSKFDAINILDIGILFAYNHIRVPLTIDF